jgi:hypothetical protein
VWVSIALSDEYYSIYRLPIEIIDLPSGYTVGNNLPETVTVRLKGDGWKLMSFELGSSKSYYVSVKGDSGVISANLLTNVENNPWLATGINILDITPKNIRIVVEAIAEKKLKIIPELKLDFKEGYSLASKVIVEPESVLFRGPFSIICQMETYKTKEISLKNLDQRTMLQAEVEELRGFEPAQKVVNIILDVQRIVENTISDIPVNVINKPSNVDVVLIPNSVSCTFRGGVNILGKVTSADIIATVDYYSVISDTLGFIRPEIQSPENLNLLSVKPDKLKYVIKKY